MLVDIVCFTVVKYIFMLNVNIILTIPVTFLEYGYRTCGPDGRWQGQFPGDYSMPRGYTNYTDCYTPETFDLYKRFFLSKTPAQKQVNIGLVYDCLL